MLRREVTMRWIALLPVLVLLRPSAAEAGKKKKTNEATEPSTIELPCGFVPGEVRRYTYSKVTRKALPTGPTTRRLRFDLLMEVVSFDGTTSVVDVTQGPIDMIGSDPSDPVTGPMNAALAKHLAEHPIVVRYATNHTTAEHTVLNMDEVLPAYIAITEDAWKTLQQSDPSLPASLGEAMRSMMTPEMVTKSVNDDVSM